MSLLTYGCPDPTKGRTEEPRYYTLWGTIWPNADLRKKAEFKFAIYNGVIDKVGIRLKNRFTGEYDVPVPTPSQFDQDFRDVLVGYGIQFEEINY